MESFHEFHDPLTMNITRQTRVLLSNIPSSSPYAATILNASTQRDLLANISRLLTKPALTLSIAIAFRPLLLPLCAQWLHDEGDEEEKLVALCLLIQPHEELFPFVFFLFVFDCR
jgi:midasin